MGDQSFYMLNVNKSDRTVSTTRLGSITPDKIVIAKPTVIRTTIEYNRLGKQESHSIYSSDPKRAQYIFNMALNGLGFINGDNNLYIYVNGLVHIEPDVSITKNGTIMTKVMNENLTMKNEQFRFQPTLWKDDEKGNAKLVKLNSNKDCTILNLYPNKTNPIYIRDYIHTDIRGNDASVAYLEQLLAQFTVIGKINGLASMFPYEGGQAYFDAFNAWLSSKYKLSAEESIQSNIMFPNLFPDVNGIALNTVGDGNCFLHAVMQAKSSAYRRLASRDDKETAINALRKYILPSFIAPVSADFLEYTNAYITDNEIPHIASFLKLNVGIITAAGSSMTYLGEVPRNTTNTEWIFMVNKGQSTITPSKISEIIKHTDKTQRTASIEDEALLQRYIDALIGVLPSIANIKIGDRNALGDYIFNASTTDDIKNTIVSKFKELFPEIDLQSASESGSNHYETIILQFNNQLRYSIQENEHTSLTRTHLEPREPMPVTMATAQTAPTATKHIPAKIESMSLLDKVILYSALKAWMNYDGEQKIFTDKFVVSNLKYFKSMGDEKKTWNNVLAEAGRRGLTVKDDTILTAKTVPEIISDAILNVNLLTSPLELYRGSTKTSRKGSSFMTKKPIAEGKTDKWINTTSDFKLAEDYTAKDVRSPKEGILFTFHVQPGVRVLDLVQTMRALVGSNKDTWEENEFIIDMTHAKDTGYRQVSRPPTTSYEHYKTNIVPFSPTAAVPAPDPIASLPAVPTHAVSSQRPQPKPTSVAFGSGVGRFTTSREFENTRTKLFAAAMPPAPTHNITRKRIYRRANTTRRR